MTTSRRRRCRVLGTALLAGVLASTTSAAAQQGDDGPDAARLVVERAIDAYRSMDRYEHRCEIARRFELEPGSRASLPRDRTTLNSLTAADGTRFELRTGSWLVVSDGTTVWLRRPDLGQYMKIPVTPAGSVLTWLGNVTRNSLEISLPERIIIDRHAPVEGLLGAGVTFESVTPVAHDRGPASLVVATVADRWYGSDAPVRIEMVFDDATGLLVESTADISGAYRATAMARLRQRTPNVGRDRAADGISGVATSVITVLEPGQDDPPDLAFGAAPLDWEREVRRFDPRSSVQSPRAETLDLVGSAAPTFAAPTTDGGTVVMDDLRGTVVLLDFWATWCPHCVRTCPDIQGISERFADEPVVVVGVNRDRADGLEKVRQFISRNGLTFPQVLDTDRSIARLYGVSTIPSTVVIDGTGVIRAFHVGVPDDQVRVLTDLITELVAELEPDAPPPGP